MMTEQQEEIILAMADCNMSALAVSKKIYLHRNTVDYHIIQITKQTGLDPRNFYDLNKLLRMCKDTSWTEKMP